MDIRYDKLDYNNYTKRINSLLEKKELIELGIKYKIHGTTKYGYPLTEIIIGSGSHDLFIVGGTHGSELIGVDFVTQLIKNVPGLSEYDPNKISLHFIPLQNPEGFDITTSTLKNIRDEDFTKESYDYYLRYRTDNLINNYLFNLNKKFDNLKEVITPEVYIRTIKESFMELPWLNLCKDNAIPDMKKLESIIYNLSKYSDFNSLKTDLLIQIDNLVKDSKHPYFKSGIERIKNSIFSSELIYNIDIHNMATINRNNGSRLYQEKFAGESISSSLNGFLAKDVEKAYQEYNIPRGSQIKFDPNGEFINLNKNQVTNKGIDIQKSGEIVYGNTPSNNIIDYADGPIGKSVVDPNNFTYSYENVVLDNLLRKSMEKGRLLGTLLYHGTGGVIYSKPKEIKSNEHIYNKLLNYNGELANSYGIKSDYRNLDIATDESFGDYLRNKYPGVLLVELSKMGGNPIAPYGDRNNIDITMNSNIEAVNNLIKECNEIIDRNKTIKR